MMRLVVVCNEAPFPPIHGGRVDVWRRLCALKAAGVDIFLVFWSGDKANDRVSTNSLAALAQQVTEVCVYSIGSSFRHRVLRLLRLWHWPSHVASRVISRGDRADLIERVHAFAPDAVWLESVYGGVLAQDLARAMEIPLFYRSHNIEHRYMERQVAKATQMRDRIAWGLNVLHLQNVEIATIRAAKRFFDISMEDLEFWRDAGLIHGEWLPPMVDAEFAMRLSAARTRPRFDVGYLGNLYSPNNVDGVTWFLEEVVPKLHATKTGLRIFIAGSRPVARVIHAAQTHGVTLIANPEDTVAVLGDARVFVNPVFAGSGVNVKSVEMLFSAAQLVSTSTGLAGLPDHVKCHFQCADTAQAFAEAVVIALNKQGRESSLDREVAREAFSATHVRELLRTIRQEIAEYKSGGSGQVEHRTVRSSIGRSVRCR